MTFRETVGAFTVPTTTGPFDLRAEWTGRDSYIFALFTNDERQNQQLRDFLETLWFAGGDPSAEIRRAARALAARRA